MCGRVIGTVLNMLSTGGAYICTVLCGNDVMHCVNVSDNWHCTAHAQ